MAVRHRQPKDRCSELGKLLLSSRIGYRQANQTIAKLYEEGRAARRVEVMTARPLPVLPAQWGFTVTLYELWLTGSEDDWQCVACTYRLFAAEGGDPDEDGLLCRYEWHPYKDEMLLGAGKTEEEGHGDSDHERPSALPHAHMHLIAGGIQLKRAHLALVTAHWEGVEAIESFELAKTLSQLFCATVREVANAKPKKRPKASSTQGS